jgi:hypothetical protein
MAISQADPCPYRKLHPRWFEEWGQVGWAAMIGFLSLFLHVLVSPFKTQARLEAEIVLLRHQLNVLRQRVPSKPKMTVASCSRRTPMICSSVNLVRFIVRLPSKTDSTHFWRSFRGSGHRRAHFIQGMTIKEIVRDLRVSGNTVRKVVRTGADGVFRPHPPDSIMGGPQCRSRREARTLRLTSTPDCWRNLKARDTNPPNRDGDKSTSKLQTSTRQ